MKNRRKLAAFQLQDGFRNRWVLRVFVDDHGGLTYGFESIAAVPLSLGNLQCREPRPEFYDTTDAKTIANVRRWLDTGIATLLSVESAPVMAKGKSDE